jgi:LAS superfamily LD-carboxypeptidase LdcB
VIKTLHDIKKYSHNQRKIYIFINMKDKYLDKVVDQLVGETTIDYDEEILYPYFGLIASLSSFYLFSNYSPRFLDDSIYRFTQHCRDVYGLTEEETEYVWKQYRNIIINKIKSKKSLNESQKNLNTFIDKVVKMMVKHTKLIPNPINHPYITKMHVRLPFQISGKGWDDTHGISPSYITDPTPRMLVEIRLHLRDIYGMINREEREEAVKMYLSKVTDMINDHSIKSLNESTKDNVLDRIAYSMYKESPPDKYPFDVGKISFNDYVKNMYGLSRRDATYVYRKFRYLKGWDIYINDQTLRDPLNESIRRDKQNEYYSDVAQQLVKESTIDDSHEENGQWTIYAPHMDRWIGIFGFLGPNFRHYNAFEEYVTTMYGLGYEEAPFVWNKYITTMKIIIKQLTKTEYEDLYWQRFNESKEDNFLDKIVGHLVDESKISYKSSFRGGIYPYLSHFPRLGFNPFPLTTSHPFSPLLTDLYYHCKEIYGLTEREVQYVWEEYKNIMRGKIEWTKSLNESIKKEFDKKLYDNPREVVKKHEESKTEYYDRLPKNIQQSIDKLRIDYDLEITDNHIQKEFEQEGNWRPDNGGVNKVGENQIKKLIKDVKIKFPDVKFPYRDIVSSYRSYDKQVINFGYKAIKRGVDDTQIANTLPGFSQHHTGNAFDIFSVKLNFWNNNPSVKKWVELNAPNYGFEVTYKTKGTLRIAEPWHLYYIT